MLTSLASASSMNCLHLRLLHYKINRFAHAYFICICVCLISVKQTWNTNYKGNQSWHKTKRYTFSFFSDIDVEKSCFLCRGKIPYEHFLLFLSFMKIFRSSRSQMFFKIDAVKNFAIFWIKKKLQHMCFPVNIAKFLRTTFLQNFYGTCFRIFLRAHLHET